MTSPNDISKDRREAAAREPLIAPEPAEVPGVERHLVCLNDRAEDGGPGAWSFLPAPVEGVPLAESEVQDLPDGCLPDEGWQDVAVPSELVMQGFDIEGNVEYYYRRTVSVPADFAGMRVVLRFDGVYSNTRVWVDGRFARSHVGGFTTWDCDVSDLVRPGEEFELVVGVADLEGDAPSVWNPEGRVQGNPSWASCYAHHCIGGILRDVALLALPQTHVESLHVQTTFDDAFVDATLAVELRLAGDVPDASVRLALLDPAGEVVARCEATRDGRGTLRARMDVSAPLAWDAEHPNLYDLDALVEREGALVERVRQRVGFREITYAGGRGSDPSRIYINGREVKLRGVCRHDVSDRYGRSTSADEDWAEIRAYRAANVNHVRTSHYPPSRHLLAACDELGMYVEDENSACFQGTGGKAIHAEPEDFFRPFAEMVERDRNHPSVIIWSLGNESAFDRTSAFRQEFDHAKAVDPSRPVIFSYPYTVESAPSPTTSSAATTRARTAFWAARRFPSCTTSSHMSPATTSTSSSATRTCAPSGAMVSGGPGRTCFARPVRSAATYGPPSTTPSLCPRAPAGAGSATHAESGPDTDPGAASSTATSARSPRRFS